MPKIQSLQAKVRSAALRHPFTTAKHTVVAMDCVDVFITLDNGMIGRGAATPNAVVTGDTLATTVDVLEGVLGPAVVGAELADFNAVLARVQGSILHNTPAKAAVEVALYDLRAQLFQTPLVTLLGGQPNPVVTDFTIGIAPLEEMVAAAKAKVAAGFTALKIKLGVGSLAADLERVQAIAAAVGPAVRLRLDANQAWTPKAAMTAAAQLAELRLPIDFIEQPVAAGDLAGLAAVTRASAIPIMADECVHTFADAQAVVAAHAADYVNIKLMKTGGLSTAVKIDDLCAANGIGCMLGCMIESQVSLAAAVAFTASHPNVRFADLDAVYMSEEALPRPYFTTAGPQIMLTGQDGL